jgi:hypothetical protein
MLRLTFLFAILFGSLTLYGQDSTDVASDSLVVLDERDTIQIETYADRFNPRKALLYAAVLPGLGQIYNKKYWKLPLVYGGIFATGVAINQYSKQYGEYRSVVFQAIEAGLEDNEIDPALNMRTTLRGYRIAVEKARRERDFFIIIMGLVYVLQIVDAHVDAHLKEFDVNPRLQVSVEPLLERSPMLGRQTGASLVIRF